MQFLAMVNSFIRKMFIVTDLVSLTLQWMHSTGLLIGGQQI